MFRHLFAIFSLLSLVLCMATTVAWLTSWRMSPRLSPHVAIGSWGDSIEMTYSRHPDEQTIWSHHSYSEFKRKYVVYAIS